MKLLKGLLIAMLTVSLCACSSGIAVPDVTELDEDTAKNTISDKGLVPQVIEENDDTVESGIVISTEPEAGEKVEDGSKVKIYVSKGPSSVTAVDSTASWTYVGSEEDEWNFYNPTIENDVLTVVTEGDIFGTSFKWKEYDDDGEGFGNASLNDTFDKVVPISFTCSTNGKVTKGKKTDITINIPLSELDSERPTTVYCKLAAIKDGQYIDVSISFSMTW